MKKNVSKKEVMEFPVKFTATVTGSISDLDVLIQNELVASPGGKVDTTANYIGHGNLIIRFRISALNGTDFKIVYKCTTSGTATVDDKNPTPIEDRVSENGFKEVKLTILV